MSYVPRSAPVAAGEFNQTFKGVLFFESAVSPSVLNVSLA